MNTKVAKYIENIFNLLTQDVDNVWSWDGPDPGECGRTTNSDIPANIQGYSRVYTITYYARIGPIIRIRKNLRLFANSRNSKKNDYFSRIVANNRYLD